MYQCKHCHRKFTYQKYLIKHQLKCQLSNKNNNHIIKLRKPRYRYAIICPACNKEHFEYMTENEYIKGAYKKYCSSFCAHSKNGKLSNEIKNKISKTFNTKIIKKCKNCNKEFLQTKYSKNQYCKICSWNLIKHKNNRWFLNNDGKFVCKICGSLK